MPLVDYASSDSDNSSDFGGASVRATGLVPTEPRSKTLKRRHTPTPHQEPGTSSDLPPLPPSFHNLYTTTARLSANDDPILHNGRKRTIPHIDGIWPTHVYLEWYPSPTDAFTLTTLLSPFLGVTATSNSTPAPTAAPVLTSLITSPFDTPLPLHISLSTTLPIPTDVRAPFLYTLTTAIRTSALRPFTTALNPSPSWVSNTDGTRWFLVVRLQDGSAGPVGQLLELCNGVARQFGLGTLYEHRQECSENGQMKRQHRSRHGNASSEAEEKDEQHKLEEPFHFSIAWSLSAPSDRSKHPPSVAAAGTAAEQNKVHARDQPSQMHAQILTQLRVCFDEVKVKIGSGVTAISLRPEPPNKRGSMDHDEGDILGFLR